MCSANLRARITYILLLCFIGVSVMTTLIFNTILCTLVFQLDGRMLAGQMKRVSGGVGRNIADALGRFGHEVRFLTAVGDDSDGRSIIQSLGHIVSIYYYHHHRFVISCEIIHASYFLCRPETDFVLCLFLFYRTPTTSPWSAISRRLGAWCSRTGKATAWRASVTWNATSEYLLTW